MDGACGLASFLFLSQSTEDSGRGIVGSKFTSGESVRH
jgi:hypothetical protein